MRRGLAFFLLLAACTVVVGKITLWHQLPSSAAGPQTA
jgi:hypothetical protein